MSRMKDTPPPIRIDVTIPESLQIRRLRRPRRRYTEIPAILRIQSEQILVRICAVRQ